MIGIKSNIIYIQQTQHLSTQELTITPEQDSRFHFHILEVFFLRGAASAVAPLFFLACDPDERQKWVVNWGRNDHHMVLCHLPTMLTQTDALTSNTLRSGAYYNVITTCTFVVSARTGYGKMLRNA